MSRPQLAQYRDEGEGQGRQYRHPTRLGLDGKPLVVPSVTTILKLEDKSALIQWAVNLSVAYCVENWFTLGSRSPSDAQKNAQWRWKDVRDSRAWLGTGIHDTIEAEHTGSWDYPVLDAEQLLVMEEWRKLNEEWLIEPILTEFTCWSLYADYAGTADGLWRFTHRVTGETFVALVDLKTSRNTWPGHYMQTSALKHADFIMSKDMPDAVQDSKGNWPEGTWSEQPMPKFDKVLLVHLRAPEFDEFGREVKPGKHDLIEVEDTETWYDEFLGYRQVLAAQQKRKANEKKVKDASWGGFA